MTDHRVDGFGRVHRGSLPVGAKVYFNGCGQRDGYATKDAALALFRDEACGVAVESKVSIFVRQFAGVYQARLSLGTPDKHGRRQATGWQWITPPPHNVTFYEKLTEALTAHMFDSGGEVNALIIGRWFDDEEEILPVACWIDFATSEYAVEFRHIATRLHTEASLDAVV